jgi:ferredoxin-type protein NapH
MQEIKMEKKNKPFRLYMVAPIVDFAFFLILAIVYYLLSGEIHMLITFLYLGVFTAGPMVLYGILSKKRKIIGRRISFFMVGMALLVGMGILGRINIQVEGFFFYLLAGIYGTTVVHYLVAKVFGPVILQRSWCGWGCWTLTILDLFPFKRSAGRIPGRWGWLRYGHFVLSLGLVMVLWHGFGYSISQQQWDIKALYWVLAGNVLYYITAIALAYKLEDNRAFCKYVCPITLFLKLSSIFSIQRIKGESDRCNECGACEKLCPMDIRISAYIKNEKRVLSTECILCMSCITACPTNALQVSLGLDLGGKELLIERQGGKNEKAA